MEDKFIVTVNVEEAYSKIQSLKNKPKRNDKMAVFSGPAGFGKTTITEQLFVAFTCFIVRALAAWSTSINMMIEDLLHA